MTTEHDGQQPASRLVFLDWLRVFAFLSVLVGHKLIVQTVALKADPSLPAICRTALTFVCFLCWKGIAGVVVFFLVSGYIITRVLNHERPAVFFVKRIFRIYPLYVAAVLMQVACLAWLQLPTPSATVLVQQLLLIGDLFASPYALDGVEWTLRIEVLFYIFMGLLSAVGLWGRHQRYLPWCLMLAVPVLASLAPIPFQQIWSRNFVTSYGLFLLLGAAFCLTETGKASRGFLLLMAAAVLTTFYVLMIRHSMVWQDAHFAVLGCLIFTAGWLSRSVFRANTPILFLSGLTYSVYLFHHWLWDFLQRAVERYHVPRIPHEFQILVWLILFCALMSRVLEVPGIKLGRTLAARLPGSLPAAMCTGWRVIVGLCRGQMRLSKLVTKWNSGTSVDWRG